MLIGTGHNFNISASIILCKKLGHSIKKLNSRKREVLFFPSYFFILILSLSHPLTLICAQAGAPVCHSSFTLPWQRCPHGESVPCQLNLAFIPSLPLAVFLIFSFLRHYRGRRIYTQPHPVFSQGGDPTSLGVPVSWNLDNEREWLSLLMTFWQLMSVTALAERFKLAEREVEPRASC